MSDYVDTDFHVCQQKHAGVHIVDTETRDGKREVITGHAAVFHDEQDAGTEFRLGSFMRERIARGAFDGALTRPDDVRGLRDHRSELLLGRTTAGTLNLSITSRGLQYEITPDATSVAKDTVRMIRRGDLTGSSFGFVVDSEEFVDDGEEIIRTIRSVNPLIDVSPVTFPAFTSADSGIARRKQDYFGESLKTYIARHRDDDATGRLETRAAKAFGWTVPKGANPETVRGMSAAQAARKIRLLEMEA